MLSRKMGTFTAVVLFSLLLSATMRLITAQRSDPFSGYKCNPSICKLPKCKCASRDAPVANPPQFVVLSFDDAIQAPTYPPSMALLSGRKNPNSCPVGATWFAQAWYSNPSLIQQWYAQGNEVAVHTLDHLDNYPTNQFYNETEGARYYLNTYAGISRGKLTGFRHPFLNYSTATMNQIAQEGYLYDSSISSNNLTIWPYTLDNGVINDCYAWNTGAKVCQDPNLKAAGLWEVPMTTIYDVNGIGYTFDPYTFPNISNPFPSATVLSMYQNTFDSIYAGNRAPFGIYIHPQWIGQEQPPTIPDGSRNFQVMKEALSYMMSKPNVWMVTNAQLIEYMKNPVSADQLGSQPYMQCSTPLPANICNGMTPSLAKACNAPTGTYQSCFACAQEFMKASAISPPPAITPFGKPVPDTCDSRWWDPVAGQCLCNSPACAWTDTSRPIQLVSPFGTSKTITSTGSGSSQNNSGNESPYKNSGVVNKLSTGIMAICMMLVIYLIN